MEQTLGSMNIFPRSLNKLPLVAGVGTVLALPAVCFLVWYYFSPWFTQVGYRPPHCVPDTDTECPPGTQPVPYSHRLHAGTLGMDCRYCHVNVERSPVAMVPPPQTCMNCHSVVRTDSMRLQPIRDAWCSPQRWTGGGCAIDPANPDPPPTLAWTRIHKLPGYVYFDHSVHVSAGVGCVECHGRIDTMDVVGQQKPLSMGWCLECHREVKSHVLAGHSATDSPVIRPADVEVTQMDWDPTGKPTEPSAYRRSALNPPEQCSGCHR
jgi:hypothetical protein